MTRGLGLAQALADALDEHIRVWEVGPGGIVLEIDSNEPDTPALVWSNMRRKHSSTYDCACSEGTIDDQIELSQAQLDWLDKYTDIVARAYQRARRDLPQYK